MSAFLPDGVPALETLKARPTWVVLKSKVPVNPHTGRNASVSEPATWSSFAAAAAFAVDRELGLGIVLNDDGLIGIDFDDCIDEDGTPEPWVTDILAFAETYAELSPSGRGVRMFAEGKIAKAVTSSPAGVEIYATSRCLSVTGRHLPGTPTAIHPAPKTLAALLARVASYKKPGQESKPAPQASAERRRAYGDRALAGECVRVATADVGARNATLFQSACQLFELAKGECIAESRARSELEAAAAAAGLDEREIHTTLESAWKRVEAKGPGERAETRSEPSPPSQTPPLSWRTHTTSAGVLEHAAFPPMKEVIPSLIAEGATLLCGKPKKGKTWMALDIAVAIAAHRFCLGGLLPYAGDVLYIALEDNARRLQRRLRHIIPDGTPWPERLTFATAWRRLDQGGLDDMAEWIGEHPEKRLIVVDTLAAVRPMSREYGFIEDYTALSGLQRLANQYQVAILVVHHLRKAGADDFGDEISGTLGLTAAVDAFLVLRGNSEDSAGNDKAELCLRSRDIEEKKFGATFSAATCRWTLDQTTSADRSRSRILAVLAEADEPLSPAEIMRLAGVNRNIVDIQLGRLRRAGDVHRKDSKYSLVGQP